MKTHEGKAGLSRSEKFINYIWLQLERADGNRSIFRESSEQLSDFVGCRYWNDSNTEIIAFSFFD